MNNVNGMRWMLGFAIASVYLAHAHLWLRRPMKGRLAIPKMVK